MASSPQVLCLFGAPDSTSATNAVARTIGLIRRNHAVSCAEIARVVECHPDTIERAANGETLLGFDKVARLAYFFPDCAAPIKAQMEPAPTAEPSTPEQMIEQAKDMLVSAQRMLDARAAA